MGDADALPYKETFPLKAVYPYDVSKACADMLCQSYASTFDLPVAITRCGNFFGGGDLKLESHYPTEPFVQLFGVRYLLFDQTGLLLEIIFMLKML